MGKQLSIKQMIFVEFIRLELIEQAIEYAENAKFSDEEQQEALRNEGEK